MSSEPPYVGQVILERGFRTREQAEVWMNSARHALGPDGRKLAPDNVETHLWEPASPIGAKEVEQR